MSALLAMMQQKGFKSMNEFVPTADELRCNRYLLNAANSEILGPETPLKVSAPENLVDFLMTHKTDENMTALLSS